MSVPITLLPRRGVTYAWNSDHHNSHTGPEGRQHGFIAQELGQVLPELVSEDRQGYKVVAYSRLVPTLAASLSWALGRLDAIESLQQADVASLAMSTAADYRIDEAFTRHQGLGALRQRSGGNMPTAITEYRGADITTTAAATAAVAISAEADRARAIGASSSSTAESDVKDGDHKIATLSVTRSGVGTGSEAVYGEPEIGGDGAGQLISARFAAASRTAGGVAVRLGEGSVGVNLGDTTSERGVGRGPAVKYREADEAKSARKLVEENSILRGKVAVLEARLEELERKIGVIFRDRSLDI